MLAGSIQNSLVVKNGGILGLPVGGGGDDDHHPSGRVGVRPFAGPRAKGKGFH